VKRRELERIVTRGFAPAFPELRLVKDMLVRWDGDPIVRGFLFGRSQMNDRMVRLHAYAQALLVPDDVVSLGVAQLLGDYFFDDEHDEAETVAEMLLAARTDGLAFLSRVSDCSSLADTALLVPGHKMDAVYGWEIRAYCLIWTGDLVGARDALERLRRDLSPSDFPWHAVILERAERVATALEDSPDAARALLEEWASTTAAALGLTS
jgi:hypothetical protein